MMSNRFGTAALAALALFVVRPVLAQEDWDIEAEHGPATLVEFETDEGTWMNLDVSPDGRWVVFELLGDIFRVPIAGGAAELLSGGVSWEQQPRYSPDGSRIVFVSDRNGIDNLWLMDADGSNRRQLTELTSSLPTAPYWTPDGEYIVAKRHVKNTRSLGGGELWMFHIRGGSGVKLVEKLSFTSDMNEPAVSPDGRYVYYDFTGPFDYNRDVHDAIFNVNRFDRQTGDIEPVIRGAGGAIRPTPSPDGKSLAFIRRVGLATVLFVRDLATGTERSVFDGLDRDQMETWTVHGAYPAYTWTPDSERIVITFGGKLWSVDVATGEPTEIPFQAQLNQRVTDALHFDYPISDDAFRARMIRWPTITPDGRRLVFQAVGHLYQMTLPDGRPQRITELDALEYAPTLSPDGRWVAFTSWDAGASGGLWRVRLPRVGATGSPERLTTVPDQYANPAYAPDGSTIAYLRGSGRVNRGTNLGSEFYLEIRTVAAGGGASQLVTTTANRGANRRMPRLSWSADGERLLYSESADGKTFLTSIELDGNGERRLAANENAEEMVPSPDGRWVAFKELHNVYVAPLPEAGGDPLTLEAASAGVPVKKLTRYGGDWIDWSPDGESLTYVLGPTVYRHELDVIFDDQNGSEQDGNNIFAGEIFGVELTVEKARPTGVVALTGARIITMSGDQIIEDGTLVADGPRIAAVGPADEVEIPAGARAIDASGKTIIPGLVDVHAHMGYAALDINPERFWPYYANLAYGVTSTLDPSASTQAVFAQAEMVEAGLMVGPRIYSTGFVLYGAENPNKAVVTSLEDARYHVRRHKAQGATAVKSYNQLRRDVRQWIIEAAREEEILVVPEGGSMYQQNMTMVLDGHTGIEHAIPLAPLHRDALTLIGRSATGYTPTLIVGYGGVWGENYWYFHDDVFEDERLLRFTPQGILDARARRRMVVPEEEWNHFELARAAKAIVDAGGRVQLGAHGQLQGLGAHWELWMLEQGGMTPLEALRAGTLWGAEYAGIGNDVGSLEPGKLADLIVLDANPLDDIRNSERVHMVMKNGFLYDEDMNEVWPESRPRGEFRWQR
ncbi:MAG: amidohydrolase family protein [Gemmatimonadetes bacterium]|uniref:Amidohydrolase family protein n=1 Tax=Candidatus Kutchimonas denitrificans TaxID=3056748 RepID=A0AAE4Z6V0_9BACT|nr:amidohydrolase family protein [Gemmatimonadota bacterium]NIR74814.1 amidohydrolase family protein [Candidatus Kutchimonas denitrificans]NIR99925.1 amidohydrolase family protein [Gemmatimonadota bacterium]NIT65509.1 amidohydrolase family protein [Gemmatimonadota bacterium]NIU52479.1 amidohydrolase family protein [Gemmatimonadota bacterium]